jgi:hypothetical protein
MTHFKKAALALAVVSSITLVGCSNSSSSGGGEKTPNTSTQTVSGAAVKGVLKNAKVTVYELDASGSRIGEVGAATTNNIGEYEAELSGTYQGGLLEIEVTAIPGQTQMVCDASTCDTVSRGDDFELPANFKLNSIVSKQPGGNNVSAPVTAWTTMAANRAKARANTAGGIDKSAAEANFKVQQLVGFDPSKVAAKDVTALASSSSEEQQAAVMNAVVAEFVFSDDSAESFESKLEAFTKSIENDDDFGDENNDGFSVAEFAEASEQTLSVVEVSDSTAASKLQKQQEVFSDPENADGVSTPEYNPDLVVGDNATQAEKIKSFKNFVATVRAWATSIEDLDTAQLGEVVDVETIQSVFSEGPVTSLKLAQEIVNQSLDQVTLTPAEMGTLLETGNTKQISILDNGVEVGSAVLSLTDESGVNISVVGQMTGETNTNFLPFSLTIKTNLPDSAFDLASETLKSLLASSEVIISGAVEDGSGSDIARLNDVTARLQLANPLSAGSEEFVTDAQVIQAFSGASLSGNVELFAETGESFSGNVEAQVTKLAKNRFALNDVPVSIRKLRVTGTFTAAQGETFDASATLNVNNASEFDTLAWLDYSEEDRWVYEPINGLEVLNVFGSEKANLISPYVNMNVYQVDGVRSGDLSAGGFVADGQEKQYMPYYEPQTGVGPDVAASVVAELASTIPNINMEVYNPDGSTGSLTVSVSEVLSAGGIGVSWSSENAENPASLNVQTDAVPAEYQGIEANSYIQAPNGADISAGLSESGFYISVTGGDVDQNMMAALENSLGVSGASWKYFNVSSYDGSVSGEFVRPAAVEFYDECIANPEQALTVLGEPWRLSWQPVATACAEATLSSDSFEELLDGPAIAAADEVVRAALAKSYGIDLANQLILEDYFLTATENDGESYLSAGIEFPNLESESSFIDASLTLSATARNIPDMPEAKVTVTADRNSFLGGQLFATLKYDQGQYEIEVSSDNLDQPTAINGRFYDAYGKELVLEANFNAEGDFSGLSGDAFVNGEDIGDVELRNGVPVITYPNGEETVFETLF